MHISNGCTQRLQRTILASAAAACAAGPAVLRRRPPRGREPAASPLYSPSTTVMRRPCVQAGLPLTSAGLDHLHQQARCSKHNCDLGLVMLDYGHNTVCVLNNLQV